MCVYSYVCKEFNIGLTELKDKKRRDFNESENSSTKNCAMPPLILTTT